MAVERREFFFFFFYLFMKNFFILVQDLAHTSCSFQYLSQCPGCQINNSVSYGGIVLKPKALNLVLNTNICWNYSIYQSPFIAKLRYAYVMDHSKCEE